ncbi:hypothetical protein Slip_2038 [Syntrophothermus lipocalidus DSM 12680]|uniref:Uncharacterized protein n=1 Tax=Syntrophothermus lipocalidus (strain DSM 12680 / TGB-C1) TaxID=643648 RepID=D7CQ07_SYNLT|nr:hypothetical protein Slip_2038 [Syntrophothermus lipocalidus DSM 12680]
MTGAFIFKERREEVVESHKRGSEQSQRFYEMLS